MSDRPDPPAATVPAFLDHRRSFDALRYAYPVISRRSRGLSIGINLNPDRVCNFDCVYCQVDRSGPAPARGVDLDALEAELGLLVDEALSGRLWERPRFSSTPEALRRIHDFAFSGDGEPTTERRFDECVQRVVDVKRTRRLDDVAIVLITDAACLHHAPVRRGLALMDAHQGVVWAKLDAGTEPFYRHINRTKVPFERVLKNLAGCASERAIIIQSMWLRDHGVGPPEAEVDAFCARIREIEAAGALAEIHLYTIARAPAEPWCSPLSAAELDALAARVQPAVRAPVAVFYGPEPG